MQISIKNAPLLGLAHSPPWDCPPGPPTPI